MHVTVVVPTGKMLPDAGTQTIVGDGSQSSVAVTEKLTTSPPAIVDGIEMSAGHVIVGNPLSVTVIVASHVSLMPNGSSTVIVTSVAPAEYGPDGSTVNTSG